MPHSEIEANDPPGCGRHSDHSPFYHNFLMHMKVTNWYRKNKDKTVQAECSIVAVAFPESGKLRIKASDQNMDITLSPAEMYDLLIQLDNCCKRWSPTTEVQDGD